MPERDEPKRMQAEESGSELEELIRSSIATYAEPAPNSELAQRILVRIAAEARPAASRRWLPWAVALPIAACLIAFFTLFQSRPVRTPTSVTDQSHITTELHKNANIAPAAPYKLQRDNRKRMARSEVQRRTSIARAKAQSLPKLDVFPTPQPLTPAEQALVEFASRTPASERNSMIEAQQQRDTPITIAAIKIQPIELPELGTN